MIEETPREPLYDRGEVQREMERELGPIIGSIVQELRIGEIESLEQINALRAEVEEQMRAKLRKEYPHYVFQAVVADVDFDEKEPRDISIRFCALTHSNKRERSPNGATPIPSLVYASVGNISRAVPLTSLETVAARVQKDVRDAIGRDEENVRKILEEIVALEAIGRDFQGPIKQVILGEVSSSHDSDGNLTYLSIKLESGRRALSTQGYKDPDYQVLYRTRVTAARTE